MKTRYLKIVRDLRSDYTKNLMLVVAIAIGVFGIGSILGAHAVLNREMRDNYMSTVPASATIEFEGAIPLTLLDSVRSFPGIQDAERRATVIARMKVEKKWYPILLFVIDDFTDIRLNGFRSISGATNPDDGAMLVERTALSMMQAIEGDAIVIKTQHGEERSIKISGTVHDAGLAPAWQEQAGYGYINAETLRLLQGSAHFDQLRILVSENGKDSQYISEKAKTLAQWIEDHGYKVNEIQVPPPGKHPHQGQMSSVLTIFILFCFMILLLGSILVATSVATLMVKQIRQIGVMKTIGGNSWQIARLYLFMVVIVSAFALIIGIPLSRIAASAFYDQIAILLNLEILDKSIPNWVPLVQIAAALVLPLVATALPVIKGSSISVRRAMDNYGVSSNLQRSSSWVIKVTQWDFFSDTFRLSLRNAFRQRVRLIMTLGLLAAGGAMFMTAMNVSESWDKNLARIYKQRLYDQELRLSQPLGGDSVINKLKSIEGVKTVEGWNYSSTSFVTGDSRYQVTRTYPDKGHGSFVMLALPIPTKLLNPTVVEGRWLSTAESNEVVMNQLARANLKLGDAVVLAVDGRPVEWTVVGFTEDVGSPATAYVSRAQFSKIADAFQKIRMLRISYADRSREFAMVKNREVESLLEKEKIEISSSTPVWLLHNAVAGHMKVMVNSLLAMALLMAFVGMLGLMSTMSMNILERTREIGIMRAIGATPRKIRNLVVFEGLAIGIQSFFVAFIVGVTLSYYMGQFIGSISFRTPLTLTISPMALGIWLVIVVAGSYAATLYPARRAGRITTREALAYE